MSNGAILFTLGELFNSLLMFILSIKYGVGGKSRLDIIMLILALMAIGGLAFAQSSLASLILALIADSIASILTFRKLHIDPSSGSRTAWVIIALASLLALFALDSWTVETLLFPVYALATSIYVVLRARPQTRGRQVAQKLEKL